MPAALVERDRKLEVLGDRVRREATGLFERLTAEDHVRAAAEHGSPAVLAAGDRAEEQRLLMPGSPWDAGLVAIGVVLGCLHEGESVVVLEVAEGRLQELRGQDVIAVDDRDERRVGLRERVVDVAGLGVVVDRPAQVPDPVHLCEPAHLVAVAVVEQPDANVIAAHPGCRHERHLHDLRRLVIARDEHVHGYRPGGWLRLPHTLEGAGPPEPEGLHHVEQLRADQQHVEHRLADARGVQEPRQVEDDQRHADERRQTHSRADRNPAPHRVPPRPLQADVQGVRAHRYLHTWTPGYVWWLTSLRVAFSAPSSRFLNARGLPESAPDVMTNTLPAWSRVGRCVVSGEASSPGEKCANTTLRLAGS